MTQFTKLLRMCEAMSERDTDNRKLKAFTCSGFAEYLIYTLEHIDTRDIAMKEVCVRSLEEVSKILRNLRN